MRVCNHSLCPSLGSVLLQVSVSGNDQVPRMATCQQPLTDFSSRQVCSFGRTSLSGTMFPVNSKDRHLMILRSTMIRGHRDHRLKMEPPGCLHWFLLLLLPCFLNYFLSFFFAHRPPSRFLCFRRRPFLLPNSCSLAPRPFLVLLV